MTGPEPDRPPFAVDTLAHPRHHELSASAGRPDAHAAGGRSPRAIGSGQAQPASMISNVPVSAPLSISGAGRSATVTRDVWSKILRPALADREGRATFISSVNGRNEFYRIYKAALEAPDELFTMNLRASLSGLLPPKELAALRGQMSDAEYQQEFENDFDVAAKGSYYGKLVPDAEADGRICG